MKTRKFIYALFTMILFNLAIYPQANEGVDPSFVPKVTATTTNVKIRLQPDGKLLAFGRIVNQVARYNTDGSLDTSFNCTGCANIIAGSVAAQADGKIIVGGTTPENSRISKVIRINNDGSLDTTFSNALNGSPNNNFSTIIVYDFQSDGKIYIGLNEAFLGDNYTTIYRLNTDGSVDNSFTPLFNNTTGRIAIQGSVDLKVLPDGRVFIFGNTAYGVIAQLNSDGSKSSAFETPAFESISLMIRPKVNSIDLMAGGKIAIGGYFTSVNGVARRDIARLNADSSVDLTFNPQFSFGISNGSGIVKTVSGNKLLVADGAFSTPQKLFRLNSDGSVDDTYTPPIGLINFSAVDSQDRAYFLVAVGTNPTYKITRLNADGTLDADYNPVLDQVGSVNSLAVQTNGKIVAAGNFERVNGLTRNRVSRINPDGTTDPSFSPAILPFNTINEIAVQTDDKVIIGGFGLARLNSDGSLDTGFNVNIPGNVYAVAVQSDGKILVGGRFSTVNGASRSLIARLNADGTLDNSFNPIIGGATNAAVNEIITQTDGKIVIGGLFSGVNGFNRTNLARLNSDGTLDTSFNSTQSEIYQIIRQPDGKYLLRILTDIKRVNADGSADNTFATIDASGAIFSMYLQPDGKIVFGGDFSTVNGASKHSIARASQNGSLDNLFLPSGANNVVRAFAAQPDGQLIVGGDFDKIGNVTRFALARLTLISAPSRAKFDFDGDGRGDVSVFRPSNGAWYINQSQNGFTGLTFGFGTDLPVPADYDGDGKTDVAVFRASNGGWYYLRSSDSIFVGLQWGQNGDIPIPGDYDGDGKADINIFRPSDGGWYRLNSSNNQFVGNAFGQNGDVPLLGDFNGDGKDDLAVFRPSAGYWYIARPTGVPGQNFNAIPFGLATDIPTPADYDGDGKTDVSVFRPSNGAWYRLNSSNGSAFGVAFGQNGDIPVAADYDGDGKANLAVFRPSANSWYIARPTGTPGQNFDAVVFGFGTDKPLPAAFQQ